MRKPKAVKKAPGAQPSKPLTQEQFEKFLSLATALSPENLCCDGELPQSQVRRRAKRLLGQWATAEREVGRKVTENEVWDRVLKGVEVVTSETGRRDECRVEEVQASRGPV